MSYQCVRERERPHHVERRVTIRRSESPALAASQRPGSSQSLPRQGASPALGRSMNKKGNTRSQLVDKVTEFNVLISSENV